MLPRTSEILSESKRLFTGELDREKLAEFLTAYRFGDKIRWLEIGVGDKKNLEYLLNAFGNGTNLSVTGIDPQFNADELISEDGLELICSTFQAFSADDTFDVINARHSVYYFGEDQRQVRRLADLLKPKGRLAITAWTEDCVLYALHHAIAEQVGAQPSNLTATSFRCSLSKAGLVCTAEHVAVGTVNTRYATPQQLASIVALAARNIDLSNIPSEQCADIGLRFFSSCRDVQRHTSIALYAHAN